MTELKSCEAIKKIIVTRDDSGVVEAFDVDGVISCKRCKLNAGVTFIGLHQFEDTAIATANGALEDVRHAVPKQGPPPCRYLADIRARIIVDSIRSVAR